jgi:hypothetical protein
MYTGTMIDVAEVQRRNRYWFDNWQSFACDVVVSTPEAPGPCRHVR